MKSKNQNAGIGSYQKNKAYLARRSIFKALSDGQWHRNKELKEMTKLSSRTLTKHLVQIEKLSMVEKKKDLESGKYPVPVLYKAKPELKEYIGMSLFIEKTREEIEPALMESKDPLMVLEIIHDGSQLFLIKILNELKDHKDMPAAELLYIEELFLEMPYIFFIHSLINASRKIIDEIDFDQLIVSQAKREKEIAELKIKRLEELGQIKKQPS